MKCITYKSGYKYQLKQSYSLAISIVPAATITTEFIELTGGGVLTINTGYAWDGPSGPTIDTFNFMRGSLVHDVLYQLMREHHLDKKKYREKADRILQELCKEDGMSSLRAWWVYHGVRLGGGPSADPKHDKPLIKAPKGYS